MYEKLLKLNEYKLNLGLKSFKLSRDDIISAVYADTHGNVSPERLTPVVKAATKKNVEILKQKSGLSTQSMYIYPIFCSLIS